MADISLAFDILARDRASREFDRVAGSADRAAQSGKKFGQIVGTAAVAGIAALSAVVKVGFGEVSDYAAGLAQADAVIKSTGGAAGVTSKHVEDLASSIQNYSGQTDDSIVSGENLLLTFTNLKNGVGAGNDVFDQTTKVLADMAQSLGQDTKTSAIQLGKALNDPIKGVSALQDVGVSFSDAQKQTIKVLQDTGDTAGAQKVILAELTKEFGGSAKAFGDSGPGQIAKAQRSFEDVSQSVATVLLPILASLMKLVNEKLIPAFKSATDFVIKHKAVVLPLVVVLGTLAAIVYAVNKAMVVGTAVQSAYTVVKGLFVGATNAETGAQSRGTISLAAHKVALVASAVATKVVAVAQWLLNAAMSANPIAIVVIAIAALAAGLILAYKHSETFRRICDTAFKGVAAAASFMWNDVLKPVFRFLVEAWLVTAGAILHGAAWAFGWIKGIGGKLKSAAKAFDSFRDEVTRSLDGTSSPAFAAGQGIANGIKAGIASRIANTVAYARSAGAAAANAVRHGAQVFSPSKITVYAGQMIGHGLVVGMQSKMAAVHAAAAHMGRAVKYGMQQGLSSVQGMLAQTTTALAGVRNYRLGVGANARSTASLSSMQFQPGENISGSIKAQLTARVAAFRDFGTNLARMRQRGYDPSIIAQIVAAGVDQGGPMASALAESNDAKNFNKLERQVNAQANQLGAQAGYAVNGNAEARLTALARSERQAVTNIKYEINVNGALDANAVARQVYKILLDFKRTRGTNLGLA